MNPIEPRAEPSGVALVTGANHGIGAATAVALAEKGLDVLVTFLRGSRDGQGDEYARQRAAGADEVVARVEELGRKGLAVEADLSDVAICSELFDAAERELGPVRVLVHNASGWKKDSFSEHGLDAVGRSAPPVSAETFASQFEVDSRAGALLMQEFIARHRARGDDWGRLVTLTSGEGRQFPGEVSYGAAKAALISYTLSAAAEMAADGVSANVVYPPVTDTGWITEEVRAFVERDMDHHHVAAPSEVADVIAWLCTEAGRIVTGNILRCR